jgi:hypothetical protein
VGGGVPWGGKKGLKDQNGGNSRDSRSGGLVTRCKPRSDRIGETNVLLVKNVGIENHGERGFENKVWSAFEADPGASAT